MALSREKSILDKKSLGALFRRLRVDVLRLKHRWEMAARLRMSPDIYANWEGGRSYPNAAEMLHVLQTFPEAAGIFGLDNLRGVTYPPGTVPRDTSESHSDPGAHGSQVGEVKVELPPKLPKRKK
jgi:hypothetical protein